MNLESLFSNYYQYILGLIIFIIGLFSMLIKSYFTEKGKLKALISENKKLIEQTEQIKTKYSKELEEIKKEHQLEISRRKYQYESKKGQYIIFFQLLDKFANETHKIIQEKLLPVFEEFYGDFLNASIRNDKIGESNAIVTMSNKMQELMFEANESLIRIKQETNTIRLIGSNEVIDKLNLLEFAYDKSMTESNKMMNDLSKQVLINDQEGIQNSQKKMESMGLVIKKIKDEIIELMRKELDEI